MTTGFLRCPDCSSAVRPGAPWCSLCHADLRSEEEKAAAAPAPIPAAVGLDDYVSLLDEPARSEFAPAQSERELAGRAGASSGGRHARRAASQPAGEADPTEALPANPADDPAADPAIDPLAQIDIDGMLAVLGNGTDPLASVAGRFSSKATVAMFAFGGAALLTVFGIIGMFIIGSFLH